MWRLTRRILSGIVVLLVTAACVAAAYQAMATHRDIGAQPPPGRLVDVGGHRLHLWCTGAGAPTVVLDTGLGGTAFDWSYVQPEVAEFTQVCSYDRAGMGYSDSGPRPRTSQQIVGELATLLDTSGLVDRVVLVGASFGGWNARLFANAYEERVAGLVLVDARHEDQGKRLATVGVPENSPWIARIAPAAAYLGVARMAGITPGPPLSSIAPPVRKFVQATRFRSSTFVAAADELRHASESATKVRTARRQLEIPLIVVSAGRRTDRRVAEVLDSLQRDQLALSKRSCQVTAERSGHAIALGQPEIVVDAIRAVIAASRQVAADPDCGSIKQRGS